MLAKTLRLVNPVGLVLAIAMSAGCLSMAPDSAPQPAATVFIGIPNTSANLSQGADESLEDFMARIAVAEFFHGQPRGFVVFSSVNDLRNLHRGVSTDRSDMQRCWLYSQPDLLPCSEQDKKRDLDSGFDASSGPTVYFATVVSGPDADKMLVIYDVYSHRDPKDAVDGYRIILVSQDDRWHEQSKQSVY